MDFSIWSWIGSNGSPLSAAVAVLVPLFGGAWVLIQFVVTKRIESSNRQFTTYHRLIKELVSPDKGETMFIDRQVAVVFELRKFRAYHEVTKRILTGLLTDWAGASNGERLCEEMKLTLEHISSKWSFVRSVLAGVGLIVTAIGVSMAIYNLVGS